MAGDLGALVRGLLAALIPALAPVALGEPIVIAHRGASGYLPEHTLAAYRLGIAQGADFIEPDLVVTRDGHLVARHDIYLSTTTDVAERPEFASRKRRHGGREDWFVSDFTLAEIKQLRARQPFPGRRVGQEARLAALAADAAPVLAGPKDAAARLVAARADGAAAGGLEVPTFDEVLELLQEAPVGVYPELKQPAFFQAAGHDPAQLLLAALERHGLGEARERVFIQCFDLETLRRLKGRTSLPLIMLVSAKGWWRLSTPDVPLAEIAQVADGVGAMKQLALLPWSSFVREAKALGLQVHLWTFRNDQRPFYFRSPEAELRYYLTQGIDGVFADFPDTAVQVRNSLE